MKSYRALVLLLFLAAPVVATEVLGGLHQTAAAPQLLQAAGTDTATPAAGGSPTSTPIVVSGGGTTIPPIDISAIENQLLQDELSLLSKPPLSTSLPLLKLPPISGSVARLEARIVGLLRKVRRSHLSAGAKNGLINRLSALTDGLGSALDVQDQIDSLRAEAQLLLQSNLDSQVAIDGLSAQIQVNLDKLRVSVESTATADVTASVGSIAVTVTAGADTIQAQLGAQTNRLLVTVVTDIDLLHIATLHATANVDTSRLNVKLTALIKQLGLDLSLLITNLKVTVHADISASLQAMASLTASLAIEVQGLKADLMTNTTTKLGNITSILSKLIGQLNGTLSSTSQALNVIAGQVG